MPKTFILGIKGKIQINVDLEPKHPLQLDRCLEQDPQNQQMRQTHMLSTYLKKQQILFS